MSDQAFGAVEICWACRGHSERRYNQSYKSMDSPYIEVRSGGYYVAGTRVSLDSIVYAFREGESPDTIQRNFETLSLEQVYGAIAFYLHNRGEVDRNILEGEEAAHRLAPPLSQRNPEAWERLRKARLQAPGRL